MSDYEPTEPYIIQNGALYPANDYARAGRVWKVVVPGGPLSACIEKLTRWEAEKIVDALRGENHRARIFELECHLADAVRAANQNATLGESAEAKCIALEARLAAAERVVEAAAVYDRLGEDWVPVIDALAAWRAQK